MESLAYELSHAGAVCARECRGQVLMAALSPGGKCFVAGAMGRRRETSSFSTNVNDRLRRRGGETWDELVRRPTANKSAALLDGGSSTCCSSRPYFDSLKSRRRPFNAIEQVLGHAVCPAPPLMRKALAFRYARWASSAVWRAVTFIKKGGTRGGNRADCRCVLELCNRHVHVA
jgi:hypothetical protein